MSSIRVRLLALLLAMLVAAAAAIGWTTYRNVLAETEGLFDYLLQQMALSLRDQGEIAGGAAGALADPKLDFAIQIWSADGRPIYASRPPARLPRHAQLGWAQIRVDGEVWRTFGVATGARVIQVAQPLVIRRRLAASAAFKSVTPLVAVAPLLAILIWWGSSYALRPLGRVAQAVRERDADSLAALPASGLPDEVAPLVQSLNDLLGRLALSMDQQRAFVADAAHELRSPLTALKLQLQLLERAPDEATRSEAVKALGEGIARSTWLVEQLLALARNEPGAPPLATAAVDLAEIARGALAATVPFALSRRAELDLRAPQPVVVQGDAASLAALVRNLVDNAVRYSPTGSRIEVAVEVPDGRPTLTVDDPGPGIPAADRERVFDRFYRRDPSAGDGSGLGLAIVRRVAERHGATIALAESPAGGLRVAVHFPPGA